MLSVTQGGIVPFFFFFFFLSLWYDSIWNWTLISLAIAEHSNHYANGQFFQSYTNIKILDFYNVDGITEIFNF